MGVKYGATSDIDVEFGLNYYQNEQAKWGQDDQGNKTGEYYVNSFEAVGLRRMEARLGCFEWRISLLDSWGRSRRSRIPHLLNSISLDCCGRSLHYQRCDVDGFGRTPCDL